MLGLVGIIAFFLVLGLSLVITRLATRALTFTGLSKSAARFQARSAFTGTGFTTSEAEKVVDHPVRRRIIMWLMIMRSAGLVTIIISLILSFMTTGGEVDRLARLGWMLGGVILLWALASSKRLDRILSPVMDRALKRWTYIDTRDYGSLLKLTGDYQVNELYIREGDWLARKTLRECKLTEEGVTVLGINRQDGQYLGAPQADTEIYPGDTLVVYGKQEMLQNLDERRAGFRGEKQHQEAVSKQRVEIAKQQQEEQEYRQKQANPGRETENEQQ